MKSINYLSLIVLFVINVTCLQAEDLRKIYINYNYSSYIYFPENLWKAELGIPKDIDAVLEGNTLKVTALREFDYTTNLTVYTKSGGVYAFFIAFNKNPQTLYQSVEENEMLNRKHMRGPKPYVKTEEELEAEQKIKEKEDAIKEAKLKEDNAILKNCEKILEEFSNAVPVAGDQKGKVVFLLYPVLAKDNYLYFVVSFENKSKIDYHIENIFTSETNRRKRFKRSAVLSNMIQPYLVYENNQDQTEEKLVRANGGEKVMVLAFKRFTIDDDKLLQWEVYEVGGERNLKTRINAKIFYDANNFE